jgi:hypothetical protein
MLGVKPQTLVIPNVTDADCVIIVTGGLGADCVIEQDVKASILAVLTHFWPPSFET